MESMILVDPTVICSSFPSNPDNCIERSNILHVIDDILEGNAQVVFIQGIEGIGKTTLLAQFAKKHAENSICLFVSSSSRWGYDVEIARTDIANQLEWILNKRELSNESEIDSAFLRKQLLELTRRAKRRSEVYYFIIDGIFENPSATSELKRFVLDELPLVSAVRCKFVFSQPTDHSLEIEFKQLQHEPFRLIRFTEEQSLRYLGDINLSKTQILELHNICNGMPGYLAAARRIILSSSLPNAELFSALPANLNDLFELEWKCVDQSDERETRYLALLAFSRNLYKISELARILKEYQAVLNVFNNKYSFVIWDEKDGKISFASESVRVYAENRLKGFRMQIYNLIIDDLLSDAESDRSVSALPGYFERAGRYDDLLDYLSPQHFTTMLSRSQSIYTLQQKADAGISAALRLHRDSDLIRLTLQKSAIAQIGGAEVWNSEVEARGATNDYESAIALAHSALAREDRLQLLATIARLKRQQNLYPEAELIEHIKSLYSQVDPISLGSRASTIAADLLYINPDIAIEFLEKAMRTDTSGNSTDWALAKLSILAFQATSADKKIMPPDIQGSKQEVDIAEAIRARIKNPSVREFSNAASVLLGEYSSAEIVSQVGRLNKVSEQMLLLRLWITQNRTSPEAADVIEYALDLLLRKSADLSPNAQLYRELASPLPHLIDHSKLVKLLASFDSHRASIERLGPSEEYVRLQIGLARAEFLIDSPKAASRLEEIYVYSADVDDLSAKAGCLAWLWGAMPLIDPEETLEADLRLHSSIRQELFKTYDDILAESAEQYVATRSVVKALARTRPELTLEFIRRLNILSRRDFAMSDFIETYLRQKLEQVSPQMIICALDEISSGWLKDNAIVTVTEILSNAAQTRQSKVKDFLPILDLIEKMDSLADKCKAYSNFYLALGGEGAADSGEVQHVIEKLKASWESIDVGWRKVEIGFKVTSSLAKSSITRAREFLKNTETVRIDLTLDSDAAAQSYVACVMLAIRAFSGLLPRTIATDQDIERISALIDRIPSAGQRAVLWGEVAIRYNIASRFDEMRRCVFERINPLLPSIECEGATYRGDILRSVAPAIYCTHPETALELISKLSSDSQDACYEQIIYFLLRKTSVSDPYDSIPGQLYKLSYSDILDICNLLGKMQGDGRIYALIKTLADTVSSRKNKDKYTQDQKNSIAKKLLTITSQKFPASGGIQHNGYKLCAQAQIARLQGDRVSVNWPSLIAEGKRIQNTSDRAFVIGTIASAMRIDNKNMEISDKLIAEVKYMIDTIRIEFDRKERYEFLATLVVDFDKTLWRACMQAAFLTKLSAYNPLELLRLQKRTIDLAHTLDPNYAASLIALIDDEPARQHEKAAMRGHLNMLDFRKKMLECFEPERQGAERKLISDGEAYSGAAWRNLGSLNADRIGTVHFDHTREFIRVAANFPIMESYPILAWIIENANRRLGKTDNVRSHIRPIFEATLIATELAERMAVRSSRQQRRLAPSLSQVPPGGNHLVRPGERERALTLLREWCELNVKDSLLICDPFFGPDDLEILQMIRAISSQCVIEILTSTKHHNNERMTKPWEDTYRNNWRRLSSQDPPDTKIVIVGARSSGDHPMQDRWWLAGTAGLRMGASLNSLGITKESEITFLSREEATNISADICVFLRLNRREFNGERLDYSIFTL